MDERHHPGRQQRLGPDGALQRVGGVRWTIRGGIVYDAPALLADVRRIVAEAKKDRGAEAPRSE